MRRRSRWRRLPFHGMSAYPYPASEKFPDDADALDYQLNWNDRFDSGEPVAVRYRLLNYQMRTALTAGRTIDRVLMGGLSRQSRLQP